MAAGVVRHSAGVHRGSARTDSRQPRSSSKRRRTDHGCRPRRFCRDGSRRPMVGHRPCPTDPSRPRTRGGRAPLDDEHVRRSWCCPPPRRMVGPGALQGLPPVEFPPGRPLVLAVAGLCRVWPYVSPPVRGDERRSAPAPAIARIARRDGMAVRPAHQVEPRTRPSMASGPHAQWSA